MTPKITWIQDPIANLFKFKTEDVQCAALRPGKVLKRYAFDLVRSEGGPSMDPTSLARKPVK